MAGGKDETTVLHETAPIVRMIFRMYADGVGRGKLRDYLNEKRIPTPLAVYHMRGDRHSQKMENEETHYQWSIYSITRIVKNKVYIGNAVHYRYRKANHKSKKKMQPKDKQLVIPDTHEAIIDMDTWERVQKWFRSHPKRTVTHENIFMGITRCADCGNSLAFQKKHSATSKNPTRSLICATYRTLGKVRCTAHYTNYIMLCEVVKQRLNRIIGMVKLDEDRVRSRILKEKDQNRGLAGETAAKKIARHEKRL